MFTGEWARSLHQLPQVDIFHPAESSVPVQYGVVQNTMCIGGFVDNTLATTRVGLEGL